MKTANMPIFGAIAALGIAQPLVRRGQGQEKLARRHRIKT
jgi:hypothetical protein